MPKRINSLTALRFFMIMMIVISHMEFWGGQDGTKNLYDYCFHNANIAVDFFFVLSGFGLTYSCLVNEKQKELPNSLFSSVKCGYKKMKKLYWLYALTIVWGFIACLKNALLDGNDEGEIALLCSKLVVSLTMLQSLSGTSEFSHAFNGVCWFMSCLLILYMAFPWLNRKLNACCKDVRSTLLWLATLIVASTVAHYVFGFAENSSGLDDLNYGHPLFRIFQFSIGIVLCHLLILTKRKSRYEVNTSVEVLTIVIGGGIGCFATHWK